MQSVGEREQGLERNLSNFSYIFLWDVNFENLTIEFHVLYVLKTHAKFCSNWMLFTIWLITLLFIHNFRPKKLEFKYLVDNIVIDFWSFWNFTSMEDIIRTCNSMVRFSKFASNKKI